ncbi:hypothetical protein [Lacibacter sediminis]|uniref:Uncharacterized protein n=1 Tax=Lacibacter sediminis TaxID=2760713 RepID=A0A7G5XGP5_9BACT|nr:hypothetical protein [Lacibacter sediminis]QNA44648.1 hypothetical protein H4075_00175 [Lacibacter sediminis]
MQKTLFICTILSIVLSAGNCKKPSTPDPGTPASTYQPTTTGSEWNYTTTGTTASGPVNTSFKLTATSKDSVSNGKTFRVFTNSAGANEYYVKVGNDYSRISSLASLTNAVELLYLKENLNAGASWSEVKSVLITGAPVAIDVNMIYTVERGKFDTTINGTDFKDCIRIRVTPTVTFPTIDENNITYLFAKNVGMIGNKVRLRVNSLAVNVNTETKLGAFVIK